MKGFDWVGLVGALVVGLFAAGFITFMSVQSDITQDDSVTAVSVTALLAVQHTAMSMIPRAARRKAARRMPACDAPHNTFSVGTESRSADNCCTY